MRPWLLRILAPFALSSLAVLAIAGLTGRGVLDSFARNAAVPTVVIVALWNALLTIGVAYREREIRRKKEVRDGI